MFGELRREDKLQFQIQITLRTKRINNKQEDSHIIQQQKTDFSCALYKCCSLLYVHKKVNTENNKKKGLNWAGLVLLFRYTCEMSSMLTNTLCKHIVHKYLKKCKGLVCDITQKREEQSLL